MAREEFQNYGIRARQEISPTELAGRYPSQVKAEKQILVDVLTKLEINPDNRLLEIGCGPGQILIPISFLVSEATGIDHQEVCSVLNKRFRSDNLNFMSGNFMDIDFGGRTYDRILCYSVLSTLPREEVSDFVGKAISLLEPGGKMLVGDLANKDMKLRFTQSQSGKVFEKSWNDENLSASSVDATALKHDTDRVVVTDDTVLELAALARRIGCHSYILPQPRNLPWGNSREDLLVVKPD